jgi:hypothetical protein
MEHDEFTHPGIRMFRSEEGFQILLPVKAERFRRLLHLVWAVIGLGVEAALVAALLGWEPVPFPPRPALAAMLIGFTAAWAFIVFRFLWYAIGRERFIVSRDMVRVRREILGIGVPRNFRRDEIRNIRAGRFDYRVVYPSWGRMFIGHGEGEILIETARHTYAYGRGLEEDEADKLAILLKDEAHLRVPDRRRPSEIRMG